MKLSVKQLKNLVNEVKREISESPDVGRVNDSVMTDAVKPYAEDVGIDLASDVVYKFREKMYRVIASQLNKNAIDFQSPGYSSKALGGQVESFDPDGVMELSQECESKVTSALVEYAEQLTLLTLHAVKEPGK